MAKAKTPTAQPEPTATATVEKPAKIRRAPIVEAKPAEAVDDGFDPFNLVPSEPVAEAEPDKAAAELAPSATPPADETPPPPVLTPAVQKHTKRLLRDARDFRIPESVIESTDTDTLDSMVDELKQKALRYAQQEFEKQAAPKPEAPKEEPLFNDKDYEGWALPDAVEVLKKRDKVIEDLRKEQKAYADKIAAIEQREQEREIRSIRQRFDSLLTKHKDQLDNPAKQAAMGGYLNSLKRDNADQLEADFEEGLKLLGFAAATSTPPASPPKAQPTPAHEPEPEPDPLAERKAAFQQGGLQKPTARTAIELPPGEEKALRTLKEKLGAMTAQPLSPAEKKAEMDDIFG
jgi:hypothetical protein